MALSGLLLDTDTLSSFMRSDPAVVTRVDLYLSDHEFLPILLMTRFEVLRGLKAKGATRRIRDFQQLCRRLQIFPISEDVIVKASDLYADLYRRGQLIGDADLLIAATALVNGFGVATNNEAHFRRIPDLHVENWLK